MVEFVSITDDGGGSDTTNDGTTSTVSITSNNEGPIFGNLDNTPSFVEDGAAQILDADVTIFEQKWLSDGLPSIFHISLNHARRVVSLGIHPAF